MEPDKIALSFLASYAAMEMTFFLLSLASANASTREILPCVVPTLGVIFCIRFIMHNFYPVKNVLGGAKLACLLTLFVMVMFSPGPFKTFNGSIFGMLFTFNFICAFGSCITVLYFFKDKFGR